MTIQEMENQNKEIKDLIVSMKYRLKFVDLKKIKFIKSKFKSNNQLVTIPNDIITYSNMIDARIKTISNTLDKPHKEMDITNIPSEVTVFDALSLVEMVCYSLAKELQVSKFINYKKYSKYEKKDISGNIEKSFVSIYSLQKRKIESKVDFVIQVYKMIPTILKESEGR